MRIAFFGDSLTAGVPGCAYFDILLRQFPNDTLLNFGKVNDTVVSLNKRISKIQIYDSSDLAFLWIGVNDVRPKGSRLRIAVNTLLGQRPARDLDEFQFYYRRLLNILCGTARSVIAVAPVLRGEDLENPVNRHLLEVAELVESEASDYERVDFLDLRPVFARVLQEKSTSHYTSKNLFRVLLDVLTLRNDAQIDHKAAQRGLHLTLDGVHLNSIGARLVAAVFAEKIEKYRGR